MGSSPEKGFDLRLVPEKARVQFPYEVIFYNKNKLKKGIISINDFFNQINYVIITVKCLDLLCNKTTII